METASSRPRTEESRHVPDDILAIDARDVHVTYADGTEAVRGVDLSVAEGEFFGFLGPNGAGKTTTIETLVTLLRPTQGSVAVTGYDVSALRGLATTDSVVDRIRVTPTGWIQTGWFADRETLEGFRAFWQRNGGFSLRHLGRDGETDESGDGLADPQREALLLAYEMGYFEIPRAASLGDVAAELDISASSVSERLRRAQTHLVETTVASKRPAATR